MQEIFAQFEQFAALLLKWFGILGLQTWPTLIVWAGVAFTRYVFTIFDWHKIVDDISDSIALEKAEKVKNVFWMLSAALWGILICALAGIHGVVGFEVAGWRGVLLTGTIYGISAVGLNIAGRWAWTKTPWGKPPAA